MLGLGIDDLKRTRDGKTYAACNYWQICLNFQTKREIALWLWNCAVLYAPKSDIDVERLKGLNTEGPW
jgi:hypothetical protein